MGQRTRKQYTTEYKQDVINMLEQKGMTVATVAADLGIHRELIYRWQREFGKKRKENPDTAFQAEIRKLQKRVAELEEERNILKKASLLAGKH